MTAKSTPVSAKTSFHVAGRIALVDDHGPFGNPTSDSARTMVTTATTDALVVVFAPLRHRRRTSTRVSTRPPPRMADIAGGAEIGARCMRVAAIIVAAGRGARLGGVRPKQFLDLGDGKTMLR